MRRVIVNTTPIIVLAEIGKLELLRELYGEITIPTAVYNEVLEKASDWIHVEKINSPESYAMYKAKLHAGEVEVMILAQQDPKADLLIIDDNAAKKTAKFLGLTVTGTMGVLLRAKREGLIDKVAPLLDKIRENGFYLSEKVVDMVLTQAGEK